MVVHVGFRIPRCYEDFFEEIPTFEQRSYFLLPFFWVIHTKRGLDIHFLHPHIDNIVCN